MKRKLLSLSGLLVLGLVMSLRAAGEMAYVELEDFEVRSLPLARGSGDYAQPTHVLAGWRLEERLRLSLGGTLDGMPGMSSTHYFPGAGRPIIRGFSNDRIRVVSDGIDTFDASVGSLDHAVASEPLVAERIEVVRGPASLLYGSNAVGGVVNIIDGQIPRRITERSLEGELESGYSSAADGWTGRYGVRGRVAERWAWQTAGLVRRHEDLSIPGYGARDLELQAQQEYGRLRGSFVETDNFSAGLSRIFDRGFAGISYSAFSTRYGLGQEVEERIGGFGSEGELLIERELDDDVMIDLERWRVDGRVGAAFEDGFFEEVALRVGVGGYEHAELEDGVAATIFRNDAWEGRLELTHRSLGVLEGVWGFQASGSEFEATGDEAFLRPTETLKYAIFGFEEWDFGRGVLQFGARLEHQRIEPELYERDEIEGRLTAPDGFRGTGISGSSGVVWRLREGLRLNFAFNYTERLPNAQELYADGPHVGTFAYEISDHIGSTGSSFDRERAIGLDLGLRGESDRLRWEAGVFYVTFDDFIQLRRTDELAFENEDETFSFVRRGDVDPAFLEAREAVSEGDEFLPVTRYVLSDAEYYGFEAEAIVRVIRNETHRLDWMFRADYVEARERGTGDPLARIPPLRLSAGPDYRIADWTMGADLRYQFRQSRVPEHDSVTPGYAMLDLRASWTFHGVSERFRFSARLENALNREAREATSFVRDLAPRPGRNLVLSAEIQF